MEGKMPNMTVMHLLLTALFGEQRIHLAIFSGIGTTFSSIRL